MSSSHALWSHMPNWLGFLLLIGLWIAFRGILLRWRRGSMERMRWRSVGSMPPPPAPPVAAGQNRCPRCSAGVTAVAAFCPHCGLALGLMPPPIPGGQVLQRQKRSPWLLLIYILLGVIGLAALGFWRSGGWEEEKAAPAPVERPHVHVHQY